MIWDWPDLQNCKKIAWPTITFIPWISKQEIADIVGKSRGLINFCKESLGIGTMEALCLGVPVFGYQEWWNIELVSSEQWVLSPSKDSKTIEKYFDKFLQTKFDRKIIREKMLAKLN